ncbi:hypothetical protein [Adlercreutzia sp. ZJ154]|uniref:hypothetical protein n=1 Tax=Adlercreutzia sp. ZJ154 TaxID=2709790 RepID=UPI0013E9EA68|nr:hypothetical protein [Adlercreutzia sp. ZJ154]
MTLDEFKKSQRKALRDFKKLRKDSPAAAKEVATRNLREAGIINSSGKLAAHYRDVL